jgi:hypothetical protein
MQDYFSAGLIVVFGAVALLLVASRYRQEEVRLLVLSLAAHVMAGVAQVVITNGLYGYGDILGYARKGEELGAALRLDFGLSIELLRVLFQQPGALPIPIAGVGSSTGSMTVIATFICYFTGGGVYTSCIVLGVASFYGKLAIYEVFRQHSREHVHRRLLIATLLVPSVVFWSSGLLKEAVAIVGLGPVMLGAQRMFSKRLLSGSLLVAFGTVTIALVKAYILFAFVVAAGSWLYAVLAWNGRVPQVRPVHLFLGLGLATIGLTLLSKIFPQYALDALAEQAAHQQEIGQQLKGGSSYALISDASEASMTTQIVYSPIALLTSLYRPLIIEASNAQILVNALETTALLAISLFVVWRLPLRAIWTTVIASPVAFFSVTFVVMFGVAVGLATTNLGTLSRYRMPLVPFFASLLVLLLDAAQRRTATAIAQPPPPQDVALARAQRFASRRRLSTNSGS